MPKCEKIATCPFFTSDAGYSPELNKAMRERYCFTDNSECARLHAIERFGVGNVPTWLLPTDHDQLEALEDRGQAQRANGNAP